MHAYGDSGSKRICVPISGGSTVCKLPAHWCLAPGNPSRSKGVRQVAHTLAGWTAVLRYNERVAAGWRLTGLAGASHKASKAGAQFAGFPGIRELLVAQIGYSQILTAYQRWEPIGRQKREREKQSFPELDPAGGQSLKDLAPGGLGVGVSPGSSKGASTDKVRFGLAKGQVFSPAPCKKS